MHHWKLVIFDLDGTLADTLTDICNAGNAALHEMGFPQHSEKAYRHLVGRGAANLFRDALPKPAAQDEMLVAEAVRRYLANYARMRYDHTAPYAGIPELLDLLTARGIPMAVLSNKEHGETRTVVADMFGKWTWVAVQGHEPQYLPKPDQTSALAICTSLGVAPKEVLYIGDTSTDMQTAKNAGFFALGVAWGFRDEAELLAHGADGVANTPPDVARWL